MVLFLAIQAIEVRRYSHYETK